MGEGKEMTQRLMQMKARLAVKVFKGEATKISEGNTR